MAVSMSAGGSGYMRSDYMISDAAIPLRVEESMKQEENPGQFSKVLNGIGEAKKSVGQAVSVEDTNVPNDVPQDIPQDFHQLAVAVANGEIKLEDIPKELLSQNVLEELAKLVRHLEAPVRDEEVTDPVKDPAAQELMAELAVMLSAQQPAVNADDMSEELSALTVQPEVKVVQSASIQQPETAAPELTAKPVVTEETVQELQTPRQDIFKMDTHEVQLPEMAQDVPKEVSQEVPQEVSQETAGQYEAAEEVPIEPVEKAEAVELSDFAAYAEPVVNNDTPEKTDAREKPVQDAEPVSVENTVQRAEVQQISSQQSDNSGQQNDASAEGRQENKAVISEEVPQEKAEVKPQETGEIAGEISRAEVRTVRKEPEAVQPEHNMQNEQPEQRVIPQHHAQRSRVVSKSDELQMIKGTADAKPAEENAAQNMVQPQAVPAERPVIFTRADGGEVTVKPSDVAQQVAENLTERTADLDDGSVEYRVTLNPEELGRITVRMTKTADGTVSVSIAAENSRTLKIIEDNGTAIQDSLKQNGVQLESWQIVGESKQETHAEDYQGSSKNPYRESNDRQQEQDSDGESFADIIASM